MLDLKRTFSSGEVAALARVSLRQLQWWDERGLVSPERYRRARRYRLQELLAVAVITELRNSRGFSLQKIRNLMRALPRVLSRGLDEILRLTSELYLLVSSEPPEMFLAENQRQVLDRLKNARGGLICISLTEHIKRLAAETSRPGPGSRAINSERTAESTPAAPLAPTQAWIGHARNPERHRPAQENPGRAGKMTAGARTLPPLRPPGRNS